MVKANEPHIDHCHEYGHVRGLTCRLCNTALAALDAAVRRAWEGDRGAPEAWFDGMRRQILRPPATETLRVVRAYDERQLDLGL